MFNILKVDNPIAHEVHENIFLKLAHNCADTVFLNRRVAVMTMITGVWLGRNVARYVQQIDGSRLSQSSFSVVQKGYRLFNILCPEYSTRRRLVTVVLIENGPIALQFAIGHLFYTPAAHPDISFERKVVTTLFEAGLIASTIDVMKTFVSRFWIPPVRGYLAPVDRGE